jgi:presenilin-like A22 family membrane protease
MKVIPYIILLFAITQLLGITVGIILISSAASIPEIYELAVVPPAQASDPLTSLFFIGYIVLGAVFILVFARFYKGVILFKLLEAMVVFFSSGVVFFAIGIGILHLDLLWSSLMAFAYAFFLALAKYFSDKVKNISTVISSAGVGSLFGFSISFYPTLIFVLLLSLYDYIAVFKTRHMITLARELGTRKLSFSVTAMNMTAKKPRETQTQYAQRTVEKAERMDLGSGDLAVPLMLSVSAFTIGGIGASLAAAIGSTIALYITLEIVSKRRVFLPALPPICLGGVLGLLLYIIAFL